MTEDSLPIFVQNTQLQDMNFLKSVVGFSDNNSL